MFDGRDAAGLGPVPISDANTAIIQQKATTQVRPCANFWRCRLWVYTTLAENPVIEKSVPLACGVGHSGRLERPPPNAPNRHTRGTYTHRGR